MKDRIGQSSKKKKPAEQGASSVTGVPKPDSFAGYSGGGKQPNSKLPLIIGAVVVLVIVIAVAVWLLVGNQGTGGGGTAHVEPTVEYPTNTAGLSQQEQDLQQVLQSAKEQLAPTMTQLVDLIAINELTGTLESDGDGVNANSALLVPVGPEDFAGAGPLAGVDFQRRWERLAFSLGGGSYRAPAQLVGDFLRGTPSAALGDVVPSYRPGVTLGDLSGCLPGYAAETLRRAVRIFARSIEGFDRPDAVLTGVETRSSSPVRILRGGGFCSPVAGLYPCGEGAGYAGGITSAAVDGMRCAEAVLAQYAPAL